MRTRVLYEVIEKPNTVLDTHNLTFSSQTVPACRSIKSKISGFSLLCRAFMCSTQLLYVHTTYNRVFGIRIFFSNQMRQPYTASVLTPQETDSFRFQRCTVASINVFCDNETCSFCLFSNDLCSFLIVVCFRMTCWTRRRVSWFSNSLNVFRTIVPLLVGFVSSVLYLLYTSINRVQC